jgi:hypothetical protein
MIVVQIEDPRIGDLSGSERHYIWTRRLAVLTRLKSHFEIHSVEDEDKRVCLRLSIADMPEMSKVTVHEPELTFCANNVSARETPIQIML